VRRSVVVLVLAMTTSTLAASSAALATPERVSPVDTVGSRIASVSTAATGRGRAWPKGRITYVDRTRYPDAVRLAVRAWNSSGLRIRFVKAKPARSAQLVIAHERGMPCAFGVATVGYTPHAYAYVGGSDLDGDPCPWPEVALKTSHELGHVLGLNHIRESVCATMNPTTTNGVAPTGCLAPDDEAKPGRWWCRMVARPDLKRAKRLYGGTVKQRSPEWCDAYPMIPLTGPVTAHASGFSNAIRLTVTRAPEPVVPDWVLDDEGAREPGVEVHVANDGCAGTPDSTLTYVTSAPWGDVAVGGSMELSTFARDQVVVGQTCVTVWQYDAGSNYAAAPATTTVQLSPPEPAWAGRGWISRQSGRR